MRNPGKYAEAYSKQYQPQPLNRVGFVDIPALVAKVEQDIAIAKDWKPGTIKENSPEQPREDTPFRP